MRDESLKYLKEKADSLKTISRTQLGDYPGKKIVDSMLSCFSTIIMTEDSETVFNRLLSKEEELMEYGEKINSVINFYAVGGSQMKTWEGAKELYSYYRNNLIFIPELSEMDGIINEINTILKMAEPFGEMYRLSQLVSDGKQIKDSLIDKKRDVANKEIQKSFDLIQNEYNETSNISFKKNETKDNIEKLYSSEIELFKKLQDALDTYERITSSQNKAQSEVDTFRRQLALIINEDAREENPGDTPIPEVRKARISASKLIPVANRKVKSKEDVERLLNNIKDNLMQLLEDNQEIDID